MSRRLTFHGCSAVIVAATLHAPVLMAQERPTDAVGPVPTDTPVPTEDRWFPLMKNVVAERPNLPPPYGVAAMYNWASSGWDFQSATLGIDDPSIPIEAAKNVRMDIKAATYGVKGDVWVLPFLNLFAVVGRADADNQLVVRDIPLKLTPSGPVRGDVVVDFDMQGPFYTLGGVLAGGYRNFFASVDFSATVIDFGKKDAIESNQDATYSVAPRVGYVVGLSQFWVGTRYIDSSTEYKGAIAIPSGQNLAFDVEVATASWDLDLGMRTVLQKHWDIMLNAGVGDRQRISATIGYRW